MSAISFFNATLRFLYRPINDVFIVTTDEYFLLWGDDAEGVLLARPGLCIEDVCAHVHVHRPLWQSAGLQENQNIQIIPPGVKERVKTSCLLKLQIIAAKQKAVCGVKCGMKGNGIWDDRETERGDVCIKGRAKPTSSAVVVCTTSGLKMPSGSQQNIQ